ncbi:hypothetical protein ES319_A08G208300v1 [Gossypium barbadense]|nr:hypothetical protein ES319_A08G208300v1 [Gossypium barbadense]
MEPEGEGEGEVEVEGHGEAEVESDGDLRDLEPDPGESEGERVQSSQEVDIGDQREESEAKETDSDEKEDYGQRVVTSRRREVIESGSERSEENHYPDNEDEEVDQTRSLSKSPEEEKDPTHLSHSAAEIRDVFGASDEEEEEAEYAVRHDMEQEEIRSPMEEEGSYGKSKFLLSFKRIRLENNIVRWRTVRKKDGTTSYESNARFVRWSDGSLQLLIGNEVLDISVQEAQHDQSHLFLRHGKVTISS